MCPPAPLLGPRCGHTWAPGEAEWAAQFGADMQQTVFSRSLPPDMQDADGKTGAQPAYCFDKGLSAGRPAAGGRQGARRARPLGNQAGADAIMSATMLPERCWNHGEGNHGEGNMLECRPRPHTSR